MANEKNDREDFKDAQSEDSRRRTTAVTSQVDLSQPGLKKEDLPEADQKNFKDGVYRGTGTGAGPGGSTDTGGADTTSMEGQVRMGTTDQQARPNSAGTPKVPGTGPNKKW